MRCADKCEPEAPISFAHDVDPTQPYVRKSFSLANRTAVREIHARAERFGADCERKFSLCSQNTPRSRWKMAEVPILGAFTA